MMRASE